MKIPDIPRVFLREKRRRRIIGEILLLPVCQLYRNDYQISRRIGNYVLRLGWAYYNRTHGGSFISLVILLARKSFSPLRITVLTMEKRGRNHYHVIITYVFVIEKTQPVHAAILQLNSQSVMRAPLLPLISRYIEPGVSGVQRTVWARDNRRKIQLKLTTINVNAPSGHKL